MSTRTVTSWGHACITLDGPGGRLTVDPGAWSDPAAMDGSDAVLVTHEHVDHLDVGRVSATLERSPGLPVWAPQGALRLLLDVGVAADRLHPVDPGNTFTAAGFEVRVVGGEHAVIHPDIPICANAAYLVDESLLHPGDSFPPLPDGVHLDVLLVPVAAPWLKLAESIDYVRAVAPDLAVPIHDAILSDPGRALADRLMSGFSGTSYRRLTVGEATEV